MFVRDVSSGRFLGPALLVRVNQLMRNMTQLQERLHITELSCIPARYSRWNLVLDPAFEA